MHGHAVVAGLPDAGDVGGAFTGLHTGFIFGAQSGDGQLQTGGTGGLDFLGLRGYYSEKNLEDAILSQLERFILELGQGFAFLERQKRVSVDAVDYYIDLLFYHRGLNRLVAIDLKLGKFKPEYKGQMELYLKYLQQYEQKPHEESPIGLLLCSEGNTEQVELMMLGEDNIKVAQYLTELPDKEWFIDKLNRSILIAKEEHHRTIAEG